MSSLRKKGEGEEGICSGRGGARKPQVPAQREINDSTILGGCGVGDEGLGMMTLNGNSRLSYGGFEKGLGESCRFNSTPQTKCGESGWGVTRVININNSRDTDDLDDPYENWRVRGEESTTYLEPSQEGEELDLTLLPEGNQIDQPAPTNLTAMMDKLCLSTWDQCHPVTPPSSLSSAILSGGDVEDNESGSSPSLAQPTLKKKRVGRVGPPSGKKSHSCSLCPKEFASIHKLTVHLFVHLTPKEKAEARMGWKHACYFCPMRFRHPSSLVTHLVVHTRERHFHCPTCEAQFGLKSNLNIHNKTVHLKTIAAECPECRQTFSQKSNMTAHFMNMHQKIRYSCNYPECGKSFSYKSYLRQHEKCIHPVASSKAR